MNGVQKKYAKAKALKEAIQQTIDEAEEALIKELGIVNGDGSVPTRIFMIDDDETFDKVCEEFESRYSDQNNDLNEANKALREAEDALINWGLSIAPSVVRDILMRNKDEYRIRGKMIDLVFRLDSRTIPKGSKKMIPDIGQV